MYQELWFVEPFATPWDAEVTVNLSKMNTKSSLPSQAQHPWQTLLTPSEDVCPNG